MNNSVDIERLFLDGLLADEGQIRAIGGKKMKARSSRVCGLGVNLGVVVVWYWVREGQAWSRGGAC